MDKYPTPYTGDTLKGCEYVGRNGHGSQKGVEIHINHDEGERLVLHPVNSKGTTETCKLEVAREVLPEFATTVLSFCGDFREQHRIFRKKVEATILHQFNLGHRKVTKVKTDSEDELIIRIESQVEFPNFWDLGAAIIEE